MSTSYLDVLGNIAAAGETGLRYATLARAAKQHVRSLVADGVVASYLPSGEAVGLDNPEAVVCVTAEQGVAYVALLQEGGMLAADIYEQPVARMPKASRKRRGKVAASVRKQRAVVVPTPVESLESPVTPKGKKLVRRVPGNQHGETMLYADVTVEDRFEAMERKMSALLSAIEAVSA